MTNITAAVLGFAYDSPTVEFPVRTGPGTNFAAAVFRALKGTTGLIVLDVQPDADNTVSDYGRVYQWMHLQFPDGQTGWMRGHVIGIQGDCSTYGYGLVAEMVHEYTLTRVLAAVGAAPKAPLKDIGATEKAATPEPVANPFAALQAQPPVETKPAPSAAPAQKAVSGQPVIVVRDDRPANLRDQPTTSGSTVIGTIPRMERAPLLEVRREEQGQKYRWFRVDYQGKQGWVREDLVSYEGPTDALGLPSDLYPAPMGDNRWWVRGYNMRPNIDTGTWEHNGWDFGAQEGEPIYAGPKGGTVVRVYDCPKCGASGASVTSVGIQVGDPAVFHDEGWGWGYGHFVTVRYTHDQLPASTQQVLAERGFGGGSIFVVYAHLQKRAVQAGDTLTPGQLIGSCGNSGNSEAPHLHLEVRASRTADWTSWSKIADGIVDPVVLFSR
jgi:murein DD-endopeptidase MepM/ murein hydrolase activator NlpD